MKSVLLIVLGMALFSGCGMKNSEVEKMRAELDSIKSVGKIKYEKIEALSNEGINVYAVNGDTTYFEGKTKLVNYGVEFSNEVAKVIGRKSFMDVDGLTVNQLQGLLVQRDSLRKSNQK